MKYIPDSFHQVPVNTDSQCLCSPPDQLPSWNGVIIRAPEEVQLQTGRETAVLPVCGYYQLRVAQIAGQSLRLFLVRKADRKDEEDAIFQADLRDENPYPEIPAPAEERPADTGSMSFGAYFNPDVLHYVKTELLPGTYEVYARHGGVLSNKVTIRVTAELPLPAR